MNRLMFILLLAGGVAGMSIAGEQIIRQDRVQQRYVAATVQIDSFFVSPWGKPASNHFVANVRFHFDFAGHHYVGTNLTPYSTILNGDKARSLQREFSPGARVSALIDPAQPQDAVLFLDYPLAYYWLLAGSVYATVIGAGGLLGIVRPTRQTMVATSDSAADGFREVLSGKTIAERRGANLLLLVTGIVLGIALGINLLQTHGTISGDGIVLIVCLSALVLILLTTQWRIWKLSSSITQPRVFILPVPINRGTPLEIRLVVGARQQLMHLHVRAWLLCTETTLRHLGRQTHVMRINVVEYVAAEQEQSNLAAGAVLAASRRLTISAGTPASGKANGAMNPNFQWVLRLELTGSSRYIANFPLDIG